MYRYGRQGELLIEKEFQEKKKSEKFEILRLENEKMKKENDIVKNENDALNNTVNNLNTEKSEFNLKILEIEKILNSQKIEYELELFNSNVEKQNLILKFEMIDNERRVNEVGKEVENGVERPVEEEGGNEVCIYVYM
jgi:hypothetical protein